MYNQIAAPYGLTQSIGFILLNIDPKKGTPSTQLGPMMGMEPTSLSRTLKAIEGKGWIVKRSDASDGRVTRILLTDEGHRLRAISRETVVSFNQKLLEEIGAERFKEFVKVMDIIDVHSTKKKI